MKIFLRLLVAVLLIAALVMTVLSFTVFGEENYTEIRTAQDLKAMSKDGNYRLAADIAFADGTTLPAFAGHLDGNGKKITGITAPLFELIEGRVSNLTLEGAITLNGQTQIGALANELAVNGVVDSVTVNVTVSGKRPSKALVLGGVVGFANSGAEILNCKNLGNITVTGAFNAENENAIGGIVGRIKTDAKVKNCVNSGTLTADATGNTSEYKGAFAGIVGISNGTTYIENCLNEGNITVISTTLCTAGILGRTETDNSACPNIIGCVNKGDITKLSNLNENCGGIASYLRGGNIEWNINFGNVTNDKSHASGLVGYYNGSGATLNLKNNLSVGTSSHYAIINVNGTTNFKPASNFYLQGETIANTDINGVVAFADKADLVNKTTALEGTRFAKDFEGTKAINNGYPIAVWQCTHDCETVKDMVLGEICTHCSTVIRDLNCEHKNIGEWIIDTPATEYTDGERHRVCSDCGGVQKEVIVATVSVKPVDGVYTVENIAQLGWVFISIENGTVPASATVKLAKDIDTEGKLPMLTTTFTGVFDGNGKTLSGITKTLFLQFNGTLNNLTLRGEIDATAESNTEIARKTASFALNASNATVTGLVSYMNLKSKVGNINAGGLFGYIKGKNAFTDCRYYGEYEVEWIGDDAGIGGIVGWSNPSGSSITFDNCYFGGKITVTGGVNGRSAWIGGILGNESQAGISMRNCISEGEIASLITDGTDCVGGILGISRSETNVIEFCVNKGSVTALVNAGGIVGAITENEDIVSSANHGEIKAANVGGLCGSGSGVLTAVLSVDLSATGKLCSTDAEAINSFVSNEIKFENTFNLGGIEYDKYDRCTVVKATGIPVATLSTEAMFEAFVSLRQNDAKQAVRFIILTNCQFDTSSFTVSIKFKDFDARVIKTYEGKLSTKNSDLTLYKAVSAGGENYFAAPGFALFGCVITDIPVGIWGSAELTVTDTAKGTVYLEPVEVEGKAEPLTMESLPDLSVIGNVSAVYNCGPGLMSDRTDFTEEDSYMTVITSTNADKLKAYVDTLPEYGFRFESKTTVDGDDYYTYSKYGSLVYLYYNRRNREARVITDNSSDLLSKITYEYEKKAGETTEFYQYSINYTGNDKAGYDSVQYTEAGSINCGMLYIIKLPDNKVILIDSGHETQSSKASRAGLMKFLREITGTPANEKVEIAMWYFTHAHGDHVRLASDFMGEYHNQIDLQSVTYNFPSYQVLSGGYDGNTFTLKNTINRYFPDVLYHKLHTGEVLNLAGVQMDVVYTHEDAVAANGNSEIGDFNSTSTVLKITMDGKTIMLLADISGVAENAIMAMHTKTYLKSDAVQVSHHCFNYLDQLYPAIDADIAIFPQSAYNAKAGNTGKYESVMKYASEEYFAHKYTYKFTVKNGTIKAEPLARYDQQ